MWGHATDHPYPAPHMFYHALVRASVPDGDHVLMLYYLPQHISATAFPRSFCPPRLYRSLVLVPITSSDVAANGRRA